MKGTTMNKAQTVACELINRAEAGKPAQHSIEIAAEFSCMTTTVERAISQIRALKKYEVIREKREGFVASHIIIKQIKGEN